MSWKLSKKLKARLDLAANQSTSAPNPAASTPSLLISTLKFPGILTVTLHEAAGLSAGDDHYRELFGGYERNLGTPDRPSYHQQYYLPYAVLDYERSQVSIPSILGTTESPQWRVEHGAAVKFDVSRAAAELTVYLYLRNPKAARGSSQDVSLGVVRLNPFDGATGSGPQWLELQDGTGRIRISLEYTHVENPTFEPDGVEFARLSITAKNVVMVRKKDTQRRYARKTVPAAELVSVSEGARRRRRINHPFIAPLAFTFESPKGLQLYTPFISGGHLFYHQRSQRFDVDRARFYTAEVVCALECLHDLDIVGWLKPGNVLLDSLGHVVLCSSGLFRSQKIRRTPEYPAPEVLLEGIVGSQSCAADWWTLGIFLYEMLTGLPPFYDDASPNIRDKIHSQPIEFPGSPALPPSATDILSKLLDRSPEKRLGAGGAEQVKGHAFFEGIDWQKVLRRGYEPTYKPGYFVGIFEPHGVDPLAEEPQEQFATVGFSYTGEQPESRCGTVSATADNLWWAVEHGDLDLVKTFLPKTTNDRVTATRCLGLAVDLQNIALVNALLENGARCDFEDSDRPPPRNRRDNGCVFNDESEPKEYMPPLVRAVVHGNLELVELLLKHGADVNVGYHSLEWDIGSETVGFSCGRVVQLAAELGHFQMVRLLLENGADIHLRQPVWEVKGHACAFVPRGVYQRVIAGLRHTTKGLVR
ncbi:protein kinase [Diplogelasinospora grovesii]|uniref:Protein kinase n=1 Tax=Diplogelasinospora grovesii TaxID=303347 RepID=A0AAN6S520_9PEZI|nr:protein kinase [Diplogelasinospora grovesii]